VAVDAERFAIPNELQTRLYEFVMDGYPDFRAAGVVDKEV
jgi:hypothetical protein